MTCPITRLVRTQHGQTHCHLPEQSCRLSIEKDGGGDCRIFVAFNPHPLPLPAWSCRWLSPLLLLPLLLVAAAATVIVIIVELHVKTRETFISWSATLA